MESALLFLDPRGLLKLKMDFPARFIFSIQNKHDIDVVQVTHLTDVLRAYKKAPILSKYQPNGLFCISLHIKFSGKPHKSLVSLKKIYPGSMVKKSGDEFQQLRKLLSQDFAST